MGVRSAELSAGGAAYVLPFENRGIEMGVTLHHPHAQVYGYPFVPAAQHRACEVQRLHLERHGRSFIEDLIDNERRSSVRIISDRRDALAFAPPFARFPYEVWVTPARRAAWLTDLSPGETLALADALQDALRRLDGLFSDPMPYLMTINQAPGHGLHPEWGLRIEILPIRRSPTKLKYLAGTELGAGVYVNDVLPEAAAHALRGVPT
jgi:UDPglucose--hexose-1-phosphate uridylyltransferase